MLLFFSCQELVNNDQQRALTSRTPPRESSKSPTRAVSWVNRLFCSETDCTHVILSIQAQRTRAALPRRRCRRRAHVPEQVCRYHVTRRRSSVRTSHRGLPDQRPGRLPVSSRRNFTSRAIRSRRHARSDCPTPRALGGEPSSGPQGI